jgi:serine/threonine protein phosphatase PrpC
LAQPARRRTRLARGPITIGEAAPAVEAQLADEEPYRPDTIADGGRASGLTVRAASIRGLSKRYTGGPRQDDLCLRMHRPSGTLIAAVADGVSSAPRSGLAAALAVRQASAVLARQLDRGGEVDFGAVFSHAAWALVDEHRRATGDPDASVEDASAAMATTLLVALIEGEEEHSEIDDSEAPDSGERLDRPGERVVRVAAVGDSPAYMLENREFTVIAGGPHRDDGLIGGGIDALPRSAQRVEISEARLGAAGVLLLCTDGVSLPLGSGEGEVGRMLARELLNPPDIVDFARLLDFSRSTYDDDRTLIAVWPGR